MNQHGFPRKVACPLYFHMALAVLSLIGASVNGVRLIGQIYLWPLVRLTGYGSLFLYALFMLRRPGYNTRPL